MTTAPPGRTPKKHLSADVRRERLVAAALRVMKRDGIAAASTRAICAEAEMPHGAFHYCFRSKQELYAALLATDINIDLDAAWGTVTPDTDPAATLRALLRTYWEAVEADPEAQLVLSELINLALREPELHDLPGWEHRAYLDKTVAYLERFAQEADLEYTVAPSVFAQMLIECFSGVISAWLAHRDDAAARTSLDHFADLFAGLTRPRTRS
ncbi:TetR/AcrR family transcriptional regulator [Streptomyces bambusae]|uniref:TetR/AcrR family transcriptional regulator n=1 Tax=Streptomyces bambusae TaxID=1550616 RepID=UPI001CFCD6F4|nr:TetR/AcrR family transcriptional regulator [Streptomyces bambusae]MCB5167332.1 TetR/AcrR family transcriptional regulator [Streptomyces bambusae]